MKPRGTRLAIRHGREVFKLLCIPREAGAEDPGAMGENFLLARKELLECF